MWWVKVGKAWDTKFLTDEAVDRVRFMGENWRIEKGVKHPAGGR